jgi:diguanylate cyclase (GGDEF)-like protein
MPDGYLRFIGDLRSLQVECFMVLDMERKRVLLAARPAETPSILALFGRPPLENWEVLDADSLERAHFIMQHTACDALLVDESVRHMATTNDLEWLAKHQEMPTLLLGGLEPVSMAEAFESGVTMCLPRVATLAHPPLMAAALNRAAALAQAHRANRRTREGFLQCRRQVDRLVNLLWRTIPMDSQRQWFSQRHILERLQEEVARAGRHGTTFTVALGEMHAATESQQEPEELADWTSDVLCRTKRRCDVAGSYGLKGFMLLMVQTPASGGVACCRRLQSQIMDASPAPKQPTGPVRACFGLSSFRPENTTLQSLLSRAEKHLEAARMGASDGVVADVAGAAANARGSREE